MLFRSRSVVTQAEIRLIQVEVDRAFEGAEVEEQTMVAALAMLDEALTLVGDGVSTVITLMRAMRATQLWCHLDRRNQSI